MTILDRPVGVDAPTLPEPRGPRSAMLLSALPRAVHDPGPLPGAVDDPLGGEDSALALHLLYELHYRGFAGVDDRWEWEPSLLRAAAVLEAELEHALVDAVGPPPPVATMEDVTAELDFLAAADGPSLSQWMAERGELEHVREFVVHRSIYQLKEADPHTFAVPRLAGPAKAALVEIQAGEYGDGNPRAVHATRFAETMRSLGLDDRYGTYLDAVPATTLATGNLITFFGLHRRWRGALVGHLAHFEMCSVEPMGRYAAVLRRLGFGDRAARFYDVHVEADEHHAVVARDAMAATLAADEPDLAGQIIFGARALAVVEARFAAHLRDAWTAGLTSLRSPLRSPRHGPR